MNKQYDSYESTFTAPTEDYINGFFRAADEPDIAHPSLLAQQEIDSLRCELQRERYLRLLAEGDVARMRFEQATPDSFLGFPLRKYDSSDDDCKRTTWEVKIMDCWHEVVTSGLYFDEKEAVDSICQILMSKVK